MIILTILNWLIYISSFSSFQYYSATEQAAGTTNVPAVSAIPASGWTNIQLRSDTIRNIRNTVDGELLRLAILKNVYGSFLQPKASNSYDHIRY